MRKQCDVLISDDIGADKASNHGVVISTPQIIEPRLFVIHIPTIPEGLDRTQRAGESTGLAEHLAPSIVSIRYHFGAVAVNQTNDVALQIVLVGIGGTVEDHHSRLVLHIVEEVQVVAAIGHVHNVLAMQGVVGRLVANVARGVIVVHAGLLGTQTVFVVLKGDLIVALLTA